MVINNVDGFVSALSIRMNRNHLLSNLKSLVCVCVCVCPPLTSSHYPDTLDYDKVRDTDIKPESSRGGAGEGTGGGDE